MRYEMMLPHQIRAAISARWPVVLPLGVLEYHGEHMAVGMDTLAVVKLLDILEGEADHRHSAAVLLRGGQLCGRAAGRNGSVQVNAERLLPFAQELFRGLLRIGFRNIHFFIHHQTENFAAGMPTDLAFKFAARQAIFAFLERERGEGWWGDKKMADYYAQQASGEDPFNWIKGHPLMTAEIIRRYPFDHAGKGETSLLMALCPEGVDMSRFSEEKWYLRSARGDCRAGRKGPRDGPRPYAGGARHPGEG